MKTKAQRLAATLFEEADYDIHHEAKSCMRESAAELRRLDAVNAKMLKELELIANTDPVDAALDPKRAVRVSRAAIAATGGTT